jgi:beta-N-acetylhexosaminidase
VVVVRDPQRDPAQLAQVRGLTAARPDAVVVDLGWPSPERLGGAARVVTYGASRASGDAAAQRLVGVSR